MFGWFRGKQLKDVLNETKKVKVHGIIFTIRKINILNYLDGSKVLQQAFDVYQTGKTQDPLVSEKKIKEHFAEVLVAGTVDPKLSFKDDGASMFVENLFTDWDLATSLYNEIVGFTYGKKKLKLNTLQRTS